MYGGLNAQQKQDLQLLADRYKKLAGAGQPFTSYASITKADDLKRCGTIKEVIDLLKTRAIDNKRFLPNQFDIANGNQNNMDATTGWASNTVLKELSGGSWGSLKEALSADDKESLTQADANYKTRICWMRKQFHSLKTCLIER